MASFFNNAISLFTNPNTGSRPGSNWFESAIGGAIRGAEANVITTVQSSKGGGSFFNTISQRYLQGKAANLVVSPIFWVGVAGVVSLIIWLVMRK